MVEYETAEASEDQKHSLEKHIKVILCYSKGYEKPLDDLS